jgi:hypothetical protein
VIPPCGICAQKWHDPRVEDLGLCLPFEKEMRYHSIVTSPMTRCPTLREVQLQLPRARDHLNLETISNLVVSTESEAGLEMAGASAVIAPIRKELAFGFNRPKPVTSKVL